MDPNGHPAVQVVINGNGHGQTYGSNGPSFQPRTRSLAVDEALQYSPMSTAPVFGLGMVVLTVLCLVNIAAAG